MVPISALNLCGADLQASVDRTLVLSALRPLGAATQLSRPWPTAVVCAQVAERGSTRSGRKAILQRRLHALIVQAAIEQSVDNMDV